MPSSLPAAASAKRSRERSSEARARSSPMNCRRTSSSSTLASMPSASVRSVVRTASARHDASASETSRLTITISG